MRGTKSKIQLLRVGRSVIYIFVLNARTRDLYRSASFVNIIADTPLKWN